MNLSLSGSSHLPISVTRSQFRAMVPSVMSVIIQKANQRVAAAHQPWCARRMLTMPMGSLMTDSPLGVSSQMSRNQCLRRGLRVVFVISTRSMASMARISKTTIQ